MRNAHHGQNLLGNFKTSNGKMPEARQQQAGQYMTMDYAPSVRVDERIEPPMQSAIANTVAAARIENQHKAPPEGGRREQHVQFATADTSSNDFY